MSENGKANGLRRKMTVNWASLGDEDDEFFESCDRMSSALAQDLATSGSSDEDEEFDDSRMSFDSAVAPDEFRCLSGVAASTSIMPDYNVWMAEPGSINERRKRLFHGMGFSNKHLFRLASTELQRAVTKKMGSVSKKIPKNCQVSPGAVDDSVIVDEVAKEEEGGSMFLVRSRSDGEIDFASIAKRKEEFFGPASKQRLTRTSTTFTGPCAPRVGRYADNVKASPKRRTRTGSGLPPVLSNNRFGAFFLIKNLDTGKEFIVNEYDNEGMWNRLSDLQTGKQLTMEEFEKSVGYSPVVKELMRRSRLNDGNSDSRKLLSANSYLSKSLRMSKRHGVNLLKNISRSVSSSMSGLMGDKEREGLPPMPPLPPEPKSSSKTPSGPEWVRVRQNGKSCKELSALQLCQEIQAHEGSIWTIRFSMDAHYLASAGEDRVIHIWEVQECELMSMRQPDEWTLTPLHPSACPSPDRQSNMAESLSSTPSFDMKKKKGKGSQNGKKGIPDYVYVPDTVFALSERPVCTFRGHLDDVLDLSWSRSQLLLSSSMDKTVRLWDLESGSCLKLFAHNDYVTCIQFNPIDDNYFISGSLDAKVRIWNVPNRQVVDWTDLHEMVTAVCYTPDGEGAIIGTHKGSCRIYSAEDCKLNQTSQLDIQNKKKNAKKVTGFQFSPWNPAEVIVTSADSRIRILEGSDTTHKFKGFRNTSSQIAASFTPDGRYVVCASEDSQVFVWKREMPRNGGTKSKTPITVTSCEHFACKDVAMAIPWPGNIRSEPPQLAAGQSKRHSKRPSNISSPTKEERENFSGSSENSKRNLPPLPKKPNDKDKEKDKDKDKDKEKEKVSTPPANPPETESTPPEEEQGQLSRMDSGAGIGESFSSSSARYTGDSPSMSASSPTWSGSSSSLFDSSGGGGGNGKDGAQASAWGMVIVTASVGGEIRAYQNFGLPRRVGRQANLFSA